MRILIFLFLALIYSACSSWQSTHDDTSAQKNQTDQQVDYQLGPDSNRHDGVPQGTVTKHSWNSKIFPETTRDYWIYVPAQYNPSQPACVMVFQDGGLYVQEDGDFRVPIVFDNLIDKKEMPVTIGIFINPGTPTDKWKPTGPELPVDAEFGENSLKRERSFEYDTLSDRYANFLLQEILPVVGEKYNLSEMPECRAIGGISSGAICAWTVAWERPQAFRKVLSHVGTFTNVRGGDKYPYMIRSTPSKPIRIFLQGGEKDLNLKWGSWPLANQRMASALEFSGYDYKFVFGTGGHDGKHGGAILPESLRWLWRDYKPK